MRLVLSSIELITASLLLILMTLHAIPFDRKSFAIRHVAGCARSFIRSCRLMHAPFKI